MKDNAYVKQIIQLNNEVTDRVEFHKLAAPILVKMGSDPDFWSEVFKRNLTDKGYLQRTWTLYDIPFFYVFENDDFILKVHLFVPLESKKTNITASAIHHHNNYLLTTFAAFGSGYETMLFEKDVEVNKDTKEAKLKIRERFTQKERPVHMVDAWEPHVVVNPSSLSATLILWSPDKKRATDNLRSNPILKSLKTPLRKLIYLLGMDRKLGIAAKDTFQFYTKDNKFIAIPEDDFFAPTRNAKGPEIDNYSIQTVFAFMQRKGFKDMNFIKSLKASKDVPAYYHKWIDMFLNEQPIPDTFAKETINIPGGIMTIEDVIATNKKVNGL
ncbi:MAG: hypothetical protein K0S12_288 [Bacteroidetes bacterium]|nr:hypothetical protein [Bacteroidota bacterium]